MVVIARIEAPGNEGYSVRVGNRRPLVASTSGLVLYAFQPPERSGGGAAQASPATVSGKTWKAFEDRAAAARTKAYVRADSDITRHIVDLSAPVISHGEGSVDPSILADLQMFRVLQSHSLSKDTRGA